MDVESLVWIAIVLVIFAMAGSIIAKIFSKIIGTIIVGIVIVATGIIQSAYTKHDADIGHAFSKSCSVHARHVQWLYIR